MVYVKEIDQVENTVHVFVLEIRSGLRLKTPKYDMEYSLESIQDSPMQNVCVYFLKHCVLARA